MDPHTAVRQFIDTLSDYERGEIFHYEQIYYCGEKTKDKINGINVENNNGFDDEGGDYKVVLGDHIAYRYEMISKLGCGSFG